MTDADHDIDDSTDDPWSVLTRIARALRVPEADLQATLDAVVTTAVELIEPARYASINLMLRGRFSPQAALGSTPHELDDLQGRLGAGPCIDASSSQTIVRIADTQTDDRWPEYTAAAARLGVVSMLCVPLWIDDQQVGSLSLYGLTRDAFGERDLRLAELLALHSALAVSDAQRTANLRQALINRDVIGQAKGILMERHRITGDAAFALLVQASQRSNRKLAAVAEEVAGTGALPELSSRST